MTNVAAVASVLLLISASSVFSSLAASKNDTSEKMDEGLVDYGRLLEAQKDDKVLIIDVREDVELKETGTIPGSIHIPMREIMNELSLSGEDFEKKYGKTKPSLDTEMIVSCRSGRRSKAVQLDLQKAGYKNVFSYAGGWLDWIAHQES